MRFEIISREHGLSQAGVFCIYQDSRGLLWFGTEDGLNRYDGYKFIVYKYDSENPKSISHNFIRAIYEDNKNNLWIGTEMGGLNRFNRLKEEFVRYTHNPDNPESLSSNRVYEIFEDSHGELWIGTFNGLNRFNKKTLWY